MKLIPKELKQEATNCGVMAVIGKWVRSLWGTYPSQLRAASQTSWSLLQPASFVHSKLQVPAYIQLLSFGIYSIIAKKNLCGI